MATNTDEISLDKYASKAEATCARALVRCALRQEWTVSVYDGGEWTVKKSSCFASIVEALATTGEDTLRFRDIAGNVVGNMFLVYQDGPGDELIADYSVTSEMDYLYKRVIPE